MHNYRWKTELVLLESGHENLDSGSSCSTSKRVKFVDESAYIAGALNHRSHTQTCGWDG